MSDDWLASVTLGGRNTDKWRPAARYLAKQCDFWCVYIYRHAAYDAKDIGYYRVLRHSKTITVRLVTASVCVVVAIRLINRHLRHIKK